MQLIKCGFFLPQATLPSLSSPDGFDKDGEEEMGTSQSFYSMYEIKQGGENVL